MFCQILERLHVVLRRLRHQVVVHAILLLRKNIGAVWKLPLRRIDDAVGDVALGTARLLRLGAIDRDVEVGIVELLLDARIDDARHVAHLIAGSCRRHRRLPSMLLPSIWISIGDGTPKFRICVIMSAGSE